jgi:hypothetical protein
LAHRIEGEVANHAMFWAPSPARRRDRILGEGDIKGPVEVVFDRSMASPAKAVEIAFDIGMQRRLVVLDGPEQFRPSAVYVGNHGPRA